MAILKGNRFDYHLVALSIQLNRQTNAHWFIKKSFNFIYNEKKLHKFNFKNIK